MTHFINGPQKALTIKQMFNKYNYVQMTPVNNMSETEVVEDSYPELCKAFLQIKKKKTQIHGQSCKGQIVLPGL